MKLLLIAISIVLMFSCKSKNEPDLQYTISGKCLNGLTMQPIKGYKLELILRKNVIGDSGLINPKGQNICITDSLGNYNLQYLNKNTSKLKSILFLVNDTAISYYHGDVNSNNYNYPIYFCDSIKINLVLNDSVIKLGNKIILKQIFSNNDTLTDSIFSLKSGLNYKATYLLSKKPYSIKVMLFKNNTLIDTEGFYIDYYFGEMCQKNVYFYK